MQQAIAHLERLKATPGYESLKYIPEFVPSPCGKTRILKRLCIIMPNAEQLMRDYGGVLYTDATFGLVIQVFKALLLVVVDGEAHNHLVACYLTPGHELEEWLALFNAIATIPGVQEMDKVVLMHDEEAAIKTAFQSSNIAGKFETHTTCSKHCEWKIAAMKILNGKQFGKQNAKEYCDSVRFACCEEAYESALDSMSNRFVEEGDLLRAEFLQSTLAATDNPMCKSVEAFMGITNNPAEQSVNTYKRRGKGMKGRRLSLLQWIQRTLTINQKQSQMPKVEEKVRECVYMSLLVY